MPVKLSQHEHTATKVRQPGVGRFTDGPRQAVAEQSEVSGETRNQADQRRYVLQEHTLGLPPASIDDRPCTSGLPIHGPVRVELLGSGASEPQNLPVQARALSVQTSLRSSYAQVLARKARREEVNARQTRRVYSPHISNELPSVREVSRSNRFTDKVRLPQRLRVWVHGLNSQTCSTDPREEVTMSHRSPQPSGGPALCSTVQALTRLGGAE
jgi:hypothetical protein